MALKKKIPMIMLIVGIITLIASILLFAIAIPKADATYKKVLTGIIAALMLVMTLLIGYYLFITRDAEPNFFLFDRAKKKNISVDDLTFQIVNERMNFYQTLVCNSPEQLWQSDILDNNVKMGYRKVYRPLLAYKMLYDLADKDIASYWDLLLHATPSTVDSLCSALEQGGEKDMVKAFRYIMDNFRENPTKVKDFVTGNMRYIRGRMLGYIKRNIELFY